MLVVMLCVCGVVLVMLVVIVCVMWCRVSGDISSVWCDAGLVVMLCAVWNRISGDMSGEVGVT